MKPRCILYFICSCSFDDNQKSIIFYNLFAYAPFLRTFWWKGKLKIKKYQNLFVFLRAEACTGLAFSSGLVFCCCFFYVLSSYLLLCDLMYFIWFYTILFILIYSLFLFFGSFHPLFLYKIVFCLNNYLLGERWNFLKARESLQIHWFLNNWCKIYIEDLGFTPWSWGNYQLSPKLVRTSCILVSSSYLSIQFKQTIF